MFGLLRFLKRDAEPQKAKEDPRDRVTLPWSVLDAIKYNEGHRIGKKEMLQLVRDGTEPRTTFANAAFAMAFKAGEQLPNFQKAILRDVVAKLKDIPTGENERAREAVRSVTEEYIQKLPSDQTTDAAKLKRLNLGGFHTWDQRYAGEAARFADDPRSVFIVANSMMVGLTSFVRSFREKGKELHVLVPQNMPVEGSVAGMNDLDVKANYPAGYTIYPDARVESFGRTFVRPLDAVIVDDIKRTGDTEARILNFWKHDGTETQPVFEPFEVMQAR